MPKQKTESEKKRDSFLRRVSNGFTGKDIGLNKPKTLHGQDQSQEAKDKRRKAREAERNK